MTLQTAPLWPVPFKRAAVFGFLASLRGGLCVQSDEATPTHGYTDAKYHGPEVPGEDCSEFLSAAPRFSHLLKVRAVSVSPTFSEIEAVESGVNVTQSPTAGYSRVELDSRPDLCLSGFHAGFAPALNVACSPGFGLVRCSVWHCSRAGAAMSNQCAAHVACQACVRAPPPQAVGRATRRAVFSFSKRKLGSRCRLAAGAVRFRHREIRSTLIKKGRET